MTNRDVIETIWETMTTTETESIHKICGESIEMVLKASASKRTLDNITGVIIAL
jgi:DNA-binding ferritin-like protein (Dps family)